MKTKILFSIILILASFSLIGQNETDALRYSYHFPGGTARATAMGGAFGALGGDITSLNINPAGLGVFRSSEISFTPSFEFISSDAKYIDQVTNGSDVNFNINSFGYVGTAIIDNNSSNFKNINFGFGYTRLVSFNENTIISANNPYNSMTDWFADRANGTHWENLGSQDPFYSSVAWETYLIDPANPGDSTQYASAYNNVYGQEQTLSIGRSGYIGEYSLSLGANYNHKLYFGGSMGIQALRFQQNLFYSEEDIDAAINGFNEFQFNESLKTYGTGLNFKFGLLFRPLEFIRIGAAIHTPTFYSLSDEWNSSASSFFDDPNKSSEWDSPQGNYDYELNTPFKAIGSLAFIVMKQGLISIDYEYSDYSLARLRSYHYAFISENNNIKTEYKATHNVKAGIEYRIEQISLRAGFAYFDSPYKSDHINKDSYHLMYSGGIGFRTQQFYFDIAYAHLTGSKMYYLYEGTISSPAAEIKNSNNRIIATVGIRF
jgi:hypothetical protein